MIDLELTPDIKKWLDTEPASRNLQDGASLLLRVTRNKILYANITRNISRHAGAIEYHLKKIYKQRLADITHEQVKDMMAVVETVVRSHGLDLPEGSAKKTELQRGKRADHDELPEEVRQLYVENADIRRRMSECHLHLRMITPENSTCPDSDRFPWAKELLSLDRKYRDNWNTYDHYVKGTPVASTVLASDPRTDSANSERLCHMLLGKYSKAKDDALGERIRDAYAKVLSPTENLCNKMREAGLLE